MSESWPDGFVAKVDAKHRAELERLKGELAEAKRLLSQVARGTNAHPFCPGCGKVRNEEHGSWCPIAEFLAAPPPAESTPVQCEQHGREDCSRPDHAAPPDDIWWRLRELETGQQQHRDMLDKVFARLAALEAKGEPGTHAKGAKP